MEEYIDLCHFQTQEKITVLAKRTGKEGQFITSCINPAHEDRHPSMGINVIKGEYNCISRHDAKGVTWERHLREKGKDYKQKPNKKYLQEAEDKEIKSDIFMAIDTDINNWEGYDQTIKEEVRIRLPYDLCFLPEDERVIAMGAVVKAGIFKQSELKSRVKKVSHLLKKQKDSVKGKGEEKQKEKKIKTKTLIPGLIHLVREGEKVAYLLQNEGKFYIEEFYTEEGGQICKPKDDIPIYCCSLAILEEPREINYSFLLNDVIKFIKKYLELSEEKEYLILALWIFHTYLIEKFNTTPIIYFYGLKETGKTRAGEVLEQLAYKCERLTSPTEATLFRSAHYFKTALIIDEAKLWAKNGNDEVERLIKSRYKRGLKVNRCNLLKSGEDQIEYFDVFAPLVLSTTFDIPLIIQDRSIRFLMQKNANPAVEEDIDLEEGKWLRDKLTIFRANLIDTELAKVKPFSRRRLNEITNPLYRILKVIDPNKEDEFKLFVKDLEEGKKSEEGFTDTALVIEEIVKFFNEENRMFFSTVELTDRLNEGKTEDEQIKMAKVGWLIKPLGFQKTTKNAKVGYIINLEILNHLIERFNTSKIGVENGGLFNK